MSGVFVFILLLQRAPDTTVLYTEDYAFSAWTRFGGGYTGQDSLPLRNLQDAFDHVADRMRWHRSLADSFGVDWWTQQGVIGLDKDGNRYWGDSSDSRSATQEELRCLTGLALANGADAMLYWCLGTTIHKGGGGEQQAGFFDQRMRDNTVNEKEARTLLWDALVDSLGRPDISYANPKGWFGALVMDTLVPCLDSLSWVWSWCEDFQHGMPPWPPDTAEHPPEGSFISNVTADWTFPRPTFAQDTGYIHVGQFTDTAHASKWELGQMWFMLVNRACSQWDPSYAWRKQGVPQEVATYFELTVPDPGRRWRVWEANVGRWRTVTLDSISANPVLIDTLQPGGVSLYRIDQQ